MSDKVVWSGYEFGVYNPDANWSDVGGLYIFAGLNTRNQWVALYIGRAKSLQNRLSNHDNWEAAARRGATHVHARAESQQATRERIEEVLIRTYQPVLNVQLK
jgi:excinuclease UvrABC nuclease subunit